MIRYLIHRPTTDGKYYAVIAGLSTDAKPTASLITGSRFVAADTGARYMFDESAGQWNETDSPDQIDAAVQAWLDDHPEATTTVQDGSITKAKLHDDLADEIEQNTADVGVLKSAVDNNSNAIAINNKMFPVNYNHVGEISLYQMPNAVFDAFGINIYTDGKNFFTDFIIENHKNTGGTTYYISPNGSNSNNGLSRDTPKKAVAQLSNLADGDTVIFLDGSYDRDTFPTPIAKSINLIADNPGKVSVVLSDNNYTYTLTNNANVWQTTRSNVQSVLVKFSEGVYKRLQQANSLDYCIASAFSFVVESGILYINVPGITPTNENVFLSLALNKPCIKVDSVAQDVFLYMEGIKFYGGSCGTILFANSTDHKNSTLYAKDCAFMNGYGADYNAVTVQGCDSYLVNCIAAYADRDGFNYHANNGKASKHLEINCSGYCNGLMNGQDNNNGSTAHDGCTIIRINGTYYQNKGPNVSDIAGNVGGKAINMHCTMFDSKSATDAMNCDIRNGDDMESWILGCQLVGSKYNLYNPSGSIMNLTNTIYTTKNGGGTFNDI